MQSTDKAHVRKLQKDTHSLQFTKIRQCLFYLKMGADVFSVKTGVCVFFENGSLFCFLFVCLRIAVLKMGVHGLKMCFATNNMLLMHFNHAPG